MELLIGAIVLILGVAIIYLATTGNLGKVWTSLTSAGTTGKAAA